MAEGGDLHHESRAKWPISADDYELEEIIGNAYFVKMYVQFCIFFLRFRSWCYGPCSSSNGKEDERTCSC